MCLAAPGRRRSANQLWEPVLSLVEFLPKQKPPRFTLTDAALKSDDFARMMRGGKGYYNLLFNNVERYDPETYYYIYTTKLGLDVGGSKSRRNPEVFYESERDRFQKARKHLFCH